MIARLWRGETSVPDADAYLAYLEDTGVKEVSETKGFRGVYVLRRVGDERAEFLFVSMWESMEAVRAFAGEEPERAVYYPEDERFLIELEPTVSHFEVAVAREGTTLAP